MGYLPSTHNSRIFTLAPNTSTTTGIFTGISTHYRNPGLHVATVGTGGDTLTIAISANGRSFSTGTLLANTWRSLALALAVDAGGALTSSLITNIPFPPQETTRNRKKSPTARKIGEDIGFRVGTNVPGDLDNNGQVFPLKATPLSGTVVATLKPHVGESVTFNVGVNMPTDLDNNGQVFPLARTNIVPGTGVAFLSTGQPLFLEEGSVPSGGTPGFSGTTTDIRVDTYTGRVALNNGNALGHNVAPNATVTLYYDAPEITLNVQYNTINIPVVPAAVFTLAGTDIAVDVANNRVALNPANTSGHNVRSDEAISFSYDYNQLIEIPLGFSMTLTAPVGNGASLSAQIFEMCEIFVPGT